VQNILDRDFQLISQLAQQYEGQILKSMGDVLLFYFPTAINAVNCAQEIQLTFTQITELTFQPMLAYRIGIHLGDVIFGYADVTGTGVNIAARVQAETSPGGIGISQTVYEAVRICYVLNSRQMGKSSLLVRTLHRLKAEGFQCSTIDMTCIGSENITPLQWYKGIVGDLWRGFNLLEKINLKTWWKEEDVSFLQRLSHFIKDILFVQFPTERIVIFIDEIDSILSLDFPVDDFFALIRFCYNQRAINPEYNRLTFAVFGVATPSNLIADKKRTPFNIGQPVELQGFKWEEAQPLGKGLETVISNYQVVIKEILNWTYGQPFLTQKLCHLVVIAARESHSGVLKIPPGSEGFFVESVVRSRIIHKWESQDEPEHLRTIRDRLCRCPLGNRILHDEQRAGRLLGIYQQILRGVEVPTDDSREQVELLLSGLVVKQQGVLKVRNPIYQEVFNLEWVEKQLGQLRPYSQAFDAWIASKRQDASRLLRGQALTDSQIWARGKSLSDLDYQFLAASEELDRREMQVALEAERLKEVEARLALKRKNAKRQKYWIAVLSFALVNAIAAGIFAFFQYQKALVSQRNEEIEKIQKMARYSEVLTILRGHTAGVWGVAFSPDGQFMVSSSPNDTVLWHKDGISDRRLKGPSPRFGSVALRMAHC
jgi:hypothetical protein